MPRIESKDWVIEAPIPRGDGEKTEIFGEIIGGRLFKSLMDSRGEAFDLNIIDRGLSGRAIALMVTEQRIEFVVIGGFTFTVGEIAQ